MAKKHRPVILLFLVKKIFEKLVNNRLTEKHGLCDFQYGLRSSRSAHNLLTVVSDRISRACNRFGATRAVRRDIYKAFKRVSNAGLFHQLKSMEFQVGYLALFHLFSLIDGFAWL